MTERDNQGDQTQDEQRSESATGPQSNPSEPEGAQTDEQQDEANTPDPSDLSEIHADDALLDELGTRGERSAEDPDDQELNALLLSWKDDVDREPFPELVDTSTAWSTIQAAKLAKTTSKRQRKRFFVPIATAAAVLAIGFTGTALGARDAEPGDALWGVSKVLYSDHTRSIEAAASVRTDLSAARSAIGEHRYDDARESLQQAKQSLNHVTGEEDHSRLSQRHTELRGQLGRPGDPGTEDPDRTSTRSPARSSESSSSSPSSTSSSESSSSSSASSSSSTQESSEPSESSGSTDPSGSGTTEPGSSTSAAEPRSQDETP